MQDDLIGYLLNALDEQDAARLEARLEWDVQLQNQLALARKALQPLYLAAQGFDADLEPPPRLTARTCAFVSAAQGGVHLDRGTEIPAWSLIDLTIAVSVVLCTCLLFFPAINNSRAHARLAGCQNNLRVLGQSLIQFAETNAKNMFPAIPMEGNLAASGAYACALNDAGLIPKDSVLHCPASGKSAESSAIRWRIPSREEVLRAAGQQLAMLQSRMGGDYGYVMGYTQPTNGQLQGIRNRGRSRFVLMTDTPGQVIIISAVPDGLPCRQVVAPKLTNASHCNVLYEAGNVRQIASATSRWQDLFVNDLGEVCAGITENDTVVGDSATPPLRHGMTRHSQAATTSPAYAPLP